MDMRALRNIICFAATALLAAACYDDSKIWDELEKVDGEMSELAARIDSLEQQVAKNVAAIQSMVSVGSIASWNYDVQSGKGVITMVDGSVVTISQSTTGTSVITVDKGTDGKYYWAFSRDGVTIPLLDENSKRIPVSVTPALKISKDNEWLISVDGGKTWVETGISYYAEDEDEVVTEAVAFEKAETDGDFLYLTLLGGTEVKVAIVGEAVFKAAAETLWFSRNAQEKSVAVEMKNVKAFTVTEKPDGWKASMDESYLFVTSPENFTDCPSEGTVKVFVIFNNGASPDILQLQIAYEPMLALARANGVVSVKLSEHTAEDFTGYVLASWLKSEYSPETAVEWLNANAESMECRTGTATYSHEDIIPGYDLTKEYVVVAAPFLPSSQVALGKLKYEATDLVSVETIAVTDAWEIRNLRYDNADLFAVMPVPEYYGGVLEKDLWETRGKGDVLTMLNAGNFTPVTDVVYDGPATAFPEGGEGQPVNPAVEYVIWYMPVDPSGQYTEDMFVENVFTGPDVTSDASIAAPQFTVRDIKSSGFTADVTAASDVYKTYAAIVKSAAVPETEAELVRNLVKMNHFSTGTSVNTVTSSSFDPSDEVYLLAVSVSEEGGYGTIVKEKVQLKQLSFVPDLGVTVTGVEYGETGDATLSLSFTGSPVTITYVAATYTFYTHEVLQSLLAKGQYGVAVTADVSSLNGSLTLSGLSVGEEYTFYAIVTDADDNHSYLHDTYKFTPVLNLEYVKSTDAGYGYGMPVITGSFSDKTTYRMAVEMPQSCVKYWLYCADPEYLANDASQDTDMMVSKAKYGVTEHTSSETSITYEYMNDLSRIYMVWKDDAGRYHMIYEHNPYK